MTDEENARQFIKDVIAMSDCLLKLQQGLLEMNKMMGVLNTRLTRVENRINILEVWMGKSV